MSSESDNTLTSPKMRKTILRSALQNAQNLSENVNKNTIIKLEYIMDKTDIINSETDMNQIVNDREEVVLDAHVICISSQIMRRCTLNVTKELNNYVPQEFAENIINYLRRQSNTHIETTNWPLLENYVQKIFKTMPKYNSLQGCMDPLPVKETVAKRRAKQEPRMPTKRPKCITKPDKVEESVEDSVEKIKGIITKYYETHDTPLQFFKLVIHPTNYGRTIENLLHTSFLFRDGILKIVKDEEGSLLVEMVPKKVLHADKKAGKATGIQNIFALNEENWKVLTKAYQIKKPMIADGK